MAVRQRALRTGGAVEGKVRVLAHSVAVAEDAHDVTVVQEAVDQGGCPGVVAEHLPPLLEDLVAGQNGGGLLVAATHELSNRNWAPLKEMGR
jgi:hypothetical protein